MRQVALSAVKAGITRLRDKGGASSDSLYELKNGYVTAARTIRSRQGTRIDVVLPEGTKGLAWFQGKFVVFSHQVVSASDPRVEVEVIRHPIAPDTPIKEIHFAMPFLGYLYVVPEFEDGLVRHYWLEKGVVWEPNKMYMPGTLVRPVNGNGMAYRAGRLNPANPIWKPDTAYALGFVVEPTEMDGYQYKAVELVGDSPRSGATEPAWIASTGALTNDDASLGITVPDATGGDGGSNTPPKDVVDRYGKGTGASSSASSNQEIE